MALNFILDPSGFPMVKLDKQNFFIHLLPVTRYQFERFICASPKKEYGDSRYEAIETMNPRVTPAKIDSSNYEGVFISGITPEEALDFLNFQGEGFDLPKVEEWQDAYRYLKNHAEFVREFPEFSSEGITGKILKRISELPGNFFDKTFMNNCLVEWVRDGKSFAGSGSPRSSFHENAYNPESEIWRPFNTNKRMRHFGFRGVKRMEAEGG